MKFLDPRRTAIGIDIGSRIIKAAQLESGHDAYRVVVLTQLPRSGQGDGVTLEEVRALKRVLHRQGFTGRRAVLAVPENKLLRGTFDLPPRITDTMVPQVARMELARMHQVLPDSFEMICWRMPQADPVKGPSQTIAVACPHDVAEATLDVFEQGGLDVVALDVRSAAAARACASLTAPVPAITAVLDLGWGSTKLLLVCGHTVIYERLLESPSLQVLIDKLCRRFDIVHTSACHVINAIGFAAGAQDEAFDQKSMDAIRRFVRHHFGKMVEELEVPFAYADHQYPGGGVQRLLLAGGGAAVPGLDTYLAQHLDMEVLYAAPSQLIESVPELLTKVDNPATTVAVGLALFSGV